MSINWGMGVMPNAGETFMQAFDAGRQRKRQEEGQNALTAYAQAPSEGGLNALAQYNPQFVIQQKQQAAETAKTDQSAELTKRVDLVGQVAQWADSPEKWDAGVDYLASIYPDLAQYRGKFTPEARLAAISAAGEMKAHLDRQKPINMAPGNQLVDPNTGNIIAKADFAPRAVTLSPGQTAVEYRPGGGAADPETIFNNMLHTESRGQQFGSNGQPLTSSAGAIGIAQVMPGTAPEAARLAGVAFDENRYRTDPEYNKALGRAYFEKQLADFGDPEKAVAAYNAGPGRVQQAVRKGGENWKQFLPQETKGYLQSVLGGGSGTVIGRGDPKPPTAAQAKADAAKEPPAYSQSAMDAFDRAIGTANRLLTHPGFNAGVGVPSINPLDGNLAGFVVPGSNAADFRAELDALKAQVFLPMVQSMKGMGALSNAEGQKLTDAIGALDPKMSEGAFRASLQRVIGDLQTYKGRAGGAQGAPQAAQPRRQAPPAATGWGELKVRP